MENNERTFISQMLICSMLLCATGSLSNEIFSTKAANHVKQNAKEWEIEVKWSLIIHRNSLHNIAIDKDRMAITNHLTLNLNWLSWMSEHPMNGSYFFT